MQSEQAITDCIWDATVVMQGWAPFAVAFIVFPWVWATMDMGSPSCPSPSAHIWTAEMNSLLRGTVLNLVSSVAATLL